MRARRRVLPVDIGARILGKMLRQTRGARTLSQVAGAAGTSASVICDVEHVRLLPSEEKLRDIFCHGCGLSSIEFKSLLFDFRLEYLLALDSFLTAPARSELRRSVQAIKARHGQPHLTLATVGFQQRGALSDRKRDPGAPVVARLRRR